VSKPLRKVVFPVAGLGTRFLPATKVVAKEMLPVLDKPLIQYAVDEAVDAGADTLIFVTNRYKHAIADYFDKAYELEAKLRRKGQGRVAGAGAGHAAPARAGYLRYPARSTWPRPRRAVRQAGGRRRAIRCRAARRPDLERR
jgi:UTP--glucose-1-phosphate uridylyltransferase